MMIMMVVRVVGMGAVIPLLLLLLLLVREPVIGLIKWLRPKGLKVCSYVEKCAEF